MKEEKIQESSMDGAGGRMLTLIAKLGYAREVLERACMLQRELPQIRRCRGAGPRIFPWQPPLDPLRPCSSGNAINCTTTLTAAEWTPDPAGGGRGVSRR